MSTKPIKNGGLRVPNTTKVRWSHNSASKRQFVVERLENRVEHYRDGKVLSASYTVVLVGRYAYESAANHAATRSARVHGGFAHGLSGLLGLFPSPRRAPNQEVCGPAPLSPPAGKPDAAGSVSTAVVGPVLGAK